MDRLKTKRSARRAQNTKILQEARLLLTDPTVDKPKLSGIFDRLYASNNELSKLNDALEEHIADDELEAEYVTAAEYNDQAISMLAEIRCKIDTLEREDSTAETASQNSSPTVPHDMPKIGPRLTNLDICQHLKATFTNGQLSGSSSRKRYRRKAKSATADEKIVTSSEETQRMLKKRTSPGY
ncbi:hypothetical protein HPB49_006739 [Dermacentor silvarum]|uniref:Uncharacterized protein n=1 Tax=Dermacentor silvarum TaxID=543639 RepID=A0ACB8DW86_DERSI|nr:hypothetical protein HPB49_006739 [Dermacentor silvarum]